MKLGLGSTKQSPFLLVDTSHVKGRIEKVALTEMTSFLLTDLKEVWMTGADVCQSFRKVKGLGPVDDIAAYERMCIMRSGM